MYGGRNNAMRVLAFIDECNSYNFHDECIFFERQTDSQDRCKILRVIDRAVLNLAVSNQLI
jgi:hypothetical protein